MTLPEIDFHNQCTAAQRRARAIATAPRRNRYDDDDEDEFEQKTSKPSIVDFFSHVTMCDFFAFGVGLLGLRKTSAVPIPQANDIRQTQSLPPIHHHHHDAHLSPRSPTDSACSHGNEYYHRSYSSGPSPNNISLWRS